MVQKSSSPVGVGVLIPSFTGFIKKSQVVVWHFWTINSMIQNVYRWFENVSISLTQENWEDDPSQALNLYPMRENDSLWQIVFCFKRVSEKPRHHAVCWSGGWVKKKMLWPGTGPFQVIPRWLRNHTTGKAQQTRNAGQTRPCKPDIFVPNQISFV